MNKICLVAASFLFSFTVPGLLVPSYAETVPAEKSKKTIKTTKKKEPASDAFDVDLKDREFWTKGEFKMGVERAFGDNTYQIGYPAHWLHDGLVEYGYFPFSELEFPIDAVMFSAQYDIEFKRRWMISLGFKKDLDHYGDDMEDRDWVTPTNPDQLDIYSDSNVKDFDAYEYDVNFKFKYLMGATWSLDAGIGYMFQKFKYDTALRNQSYPSDPTALTDNWDGRTSSLKYKVDYHMPYVQMGGAVTFAKRFSIIANGSYSPLVEARDTDQHLLRGKENKGELDGDTWMANIETRYFINRNWFVSLEYAFKETKVDGKMEGVFFDDPTLTHTVWEELESTQHNGSLMVGYNY